MQQTARISTAFTKAFKCKLPVILPPMGGVAGPALAGAIASAGCIGFVGTGGQNRHTKIRYVSIGEMSRHVRVAQELAGPENVGNIGLGLVIKGQLDKDPTIMDQIRALNLQHIWLSSGAVSSLDEVDFTRYCKMISDSFREQQHELNLYVQVSSPYRALDAVGAGANIIVLQGKEAGGYVAANKDLQSEAMSLKQLIHDTVGLIKTNGLKMPFICAAGGISNGEKFIHALDDGADAVVVGTLFATSQESELPIEEKQNLLLGQGYIRKNPDGTFVALGKGAISNSGITPAKTILGNIMQEVNALRPLTEA